jgi:hypothetical protein
MAAVLVAARFCEPSSELHIAEDWYRRTALCDLLQVGDEQVNKDRLYRGLTYSGCTTATTGFMPSSITAMSPRHSNPRCC